MRKLLLVLLTAISTAAMAQQPTPQTLDRFLNAYQFEQIRESWAFKLVQDQTQQLSERDQALTQRDRALAAAEGLDRALADLCPSRRGAER